MSSKAIDIVKPEPKTEDEAWLRWLNHIQSQLLSLPYYKKRKIEVKDSSDLLMGPDGHLYNYDFDTEEAYGE